MKKLIKKLKLFIGNMKMQNKLMLSYLIFLFIPICFFFNYALHKYSQILKEDIITSTENNYNQTYSYLVDKVEKIQNISNVVLSSSDISNVFSIESNDNWQANNYYLVSKSMNFLSSLEDKDISRIVLFLCQNESDPQISYSYRSIDSEENSKWYKTMISDDLGNLWCPSSYMDKKDSTLSSINSSSYALIRRYNNPTDYSKKIGYFCIYFSADEINAIVNKANTIDGSMTFIVNSDNDLVYTSNKSQYESLYPGFSKKTDVKHITENLLSYSGNGKKEIFAEKELPGTDWRLITIVPSDEIFSSIKVIQIQTSLLLLIFTLACMLFAWKVSNSITRRITRLEVNMKKVEQGELVPLGEPKYEDEIGMLYKSFNFMINEIERLLGEEYDAGIEAKTAEMKTLLAQINPHFLYNTLDTIKWLIQKDNGKQAVTAISDLATFYKLSLNNGNDQISLEDELKQVSSYVEIENLRFSNAIMFFCDIDDEIGKYMVPKLILQPFVENSILHGIMSKDIRTGSIIISAMIENNKLKISICDDGVGMTDEMIKTLNSNDYDNSYGIKNVKRRIHLFCGTHSSIRFGKSQGCGTTVDIFLPVIHQ